MTSERANGYVIDETRLTGEHLNQLLEAFKQEITKRPVLAKAIPFHRPIIEQAYRQRKADFYLSFSFRDGQSDSLFGNLSERQRDDIITDSGLTIGFFNEGKKESFVHVSVPRGKKLPSSIIESLFSGKRLELERTDFYNQPSFAKENVYVAAVDDSEIRNLDFTNLEGKCVLWDFGIGTGLDFETPRLLSREKGKSSSMSAVISTAIDYTPSSVERWIFAVMTDFFCNQKKCTALHNYSRAFRKNMKGQLIELSVPDTSVAIGQDYSGKWLHVFTPETAIEKVVQYAIGEASSREVGHGTTADSTKRLIGLYQGMRTSTPKYAKRLKRLAREVCDSNPHAEGVWMLRETLKEMR